MPKHPTLEEFLLSPSRNAYFRTSVSGVAYTVYARKGPRLIDFARMNLVFDLANIRSSKPGRGHFTGLMSMLSSILAKAGYDGIYVESVLNPGLCEWLRAHGFVQVNEHYFTSNFWRSLREL